MIWRKYHLYYLLSLVVLLSTFCFGVNKVSAFDMVFTPMQTNGFNVINVTTSNDPTGAVCVYFENVLKASASYAVNLFAKNSNVSLGDNSGVTSDIPNGFYTFQKSTGSNSCASGFYETQSFTFINGVIDSTIDTSTRFITFTYSTTTQTARVQGYWNATTTPDVTERLEFHQFSTMLGIESFKQVIATSTGLFDYSFDYKVLPTPSTGTTTPAFTATTTLFARIYQYDNNYATDPFSGQFDSRYKTLLVATTTTITASTTDISTLLTARDVFAYPEYECSITSLTGCIKNALIWAFYPTQDSIEQYNDFISLIQAKAPIGYFYSAKDSLTGLSATSTSNVFDIDIPYSLKRYIFTPFDVAIAGILWFFFLINFYKRFKTIQL
jgi:hypothetical protein